MSVAPLQPMQIGSLDIEWPVFLAPMAGFTDGAFRLLCLEQGCGAVVTEMVNAHGMSIGHERTGHFLGTFEEERPIGAQIYGSNPEIMAQAADRVAAMGRFDFIDINAGCPMPKIKNRGDGAGLMRDPALMGEVVRQVKQAVAGRVPVTLKTRIGWSADTLNVLETTAAAEEGGADALFLHGRVAEVRHSGEADWGLIAETKQARTIPVVGNGGLREPADLFRMVKETGVDGLMVGRAALGNPWFFRQARGLERGEEIGRPSAAEVRQTIHSHFEREMVLLERRGEKQLKLGVEVTACLVLRSHLMRYLRGFRGIRTLAVTLEQRQDWATLRDRIDQVLETGRRCEPPPPPAASLPS
jgi:tRNA-dihydrouridine synthase B